MKIAYFTDTYEPQINGVVASIKLSAENLSRRGHEVHIFCPSGSENNKFTHQIFSKKFENYSEYKVSFPSFDILKKIKEIEPDIIHVHTPVTIGVTGIAVARMFNIPLIISYHTLLNEYMSYITSKNMDDFIDKYASWFFDRASTLIVPTTPIKRVLRKSGVKSPIEIIPTPIDKKMISEKPKKKRGELKILHVGRLCKEKRIDMVLKAFKDVSRSIDSELIITSNGPDEERLKKLAKSLGIDKNVTFTGYVSIERLRELYSNSDFFVSASDTETQGIVILEAMANGCLVIARNALGFKDVVKDNKNGLLFNNEKELSRKIIMLAKNKKLRDRLVKEGFKTADSFNIESYIEKIEAIYRENLNSKSNKIRSRIMYSCLLFSNFSTYWLVRKMDLSVNSRMINMYLELVRRMLFLGKLLD